MDPGGHEPGFGDIKPSVLKRDRAIIVKPGIAKKYQSQTKENSSPFFHLNKNEWIYALTSIRMDGFKEVYHSGTQSVQMETGHQFQVATLPSIVLLKLIAFDDRPEIRLKDVGDIANIITHFFDLQAELIYNEHVDLFGDGKGERSVQEIAATVIGREIKKCVLQMKVFLKDCNKSYGPTSG